MGWCVLHAPNDGHAFQNFAEYNVLAVQMWRFNGGDEELVQAPRHCHDTTHALHSFTQHIRSNASWLHLAAVGAGPSVGHRQKPRCCMFSLKVLVFELLAVNRLASGAIAVGEVSALLEAHTIDRSAAKLA